MSVGTRYNPAFSLAWPFFGFYSFGPAEVPPLMPIVGMVSRTDGKQWFLAYDPVTNRMALTNTITKAQKARMALSQPFDGPYVGNFGVRVGVVNAVVPGAPHISVDQGFTVSAAGPWGFEIGANQFAAILYAVHVATNNFWDHLSWQLLTTKPAQGGPAAPTFPDAG